MVALIKQLLYFNEAFINLGGGVMPSSLITKKALANSLKQLMEKIPLNKITVQDIVDNCELNRQTFYYHFQSIFDLLEWIYKTEVVESISENKSYETWTEGYLNILLYIEKNKKFCLNTFKYTERDNLDSIMYKITNGLLAGVVREVLQNMGLKEEDKELICNFFSLAFIGLLVQWFRQGMKKKPEAIVGRLSKLEENFARVLEG